jgi:myo-inositol 2-dehydrogenase / D-chiro-inositol 1-dehydrogenase
MESTMDNVRIAVIGLGRIGRMHAGLLAREIAGARLAFVAEPVPAALDEVTSRLGVPGSADPSDAMARDDVDAVAICTPTPTHVDLIMQAAAAGKAILCEKPISLDLAATDRALAAARDAGVPLQIGFNRRFDPGHAAVRSAVESGELGAPELVRISSRDPAPPEIDYLRTSGGVFRDQTIHDFDMARYVSGQEVVEVSAMGAVRVDPRIGDLGDHDTVALTLRHADGCLTQIDNSRRASYGYDQRVEVFGARGMALSDNQPEHGAVFRSADGSSGPPLPWFYLERYLPSYRREWQAFASSVAKRTTPEVTGEDGRAALVLALAAAKAVDERRTVAVDEVGGR